MGEERACRRNVRVATFWFKGPRISPGCTSMAEQLIQAGIRVQGIPFEGIRAWRGALYYFKAMSNQDADVQLPELPLEGIRAIRTWKRALLTVKQLSDGGSTTSRWALLIVQACLYNWVKSAVPDFWFRCVTEAFMQLNNDIEEAAERALAIIRNDYNDNTEVSL